MIIVLSMDKHVILASTALMPSVMAVLNAQFQSLKNPPSCVTTLYARIDQAIKEQCSLVISHLPYEFVHIAIVSSLWIIPSNPQILGSTMTAICPDKATSTEPFQQPFHVLRLPPACSATSRYFHLPPHYEDHSMVTDVSLDTANINAINISSLDLEYGDILAAIGPHSTCRS